MKNLEIYMILFFANVSSMYTEHGSLRPFGEVDTKFPLQLSSRTHFAKINDKEVPQKSIEKHKKVSS